MLAFRYEELHTEPHTGLSLFGPYDHDASSHPPSIRYGVIGHEAGIQRLKEFLRVIDGPVVCHDFHGTNKSEFKKRLLWPVFPGFEAVFGSRLPEDPTWTSVLDVNRLDEHLNHNDSYVRVHNVANLYVQALETASKSDDAPEVMFCVVPDKLYDLCRTQSRVDDGYGSYARSEEDIVQRRMHRDLFNEYDPDDYSFSNDFRRQLKARALEYGIPIQIVRESRLSVASAGQHETMTVLSDRAWNISTAIYYKCKGKPWKLADARPGVCYVGLVFRRTGTHASRTACCAAQMFLNSGDGVVFKGAIGRWYSPETRECHLNSRSAKELLEGVLTAYQKEFGQPLTEIFIHSRSNVDEEEMDGFLAAVPFNAKLVAVKVRLEHDGLRVYRQGDYPIQRGTFVRMGKRSGYLWGTGFKPDLLTYDGWDIPIPMRINIQHGEPDIEQVASDIFALTKLNYNACKLGDSQPVTIGFSNAVGEILVSNPTIQETRPNFRFYI